MFRSRFWNQVLLCIAYCAAHVYQAFIFHMWMLPSGMLTRLFMNQSLNAFGFMACFPFLMWRPRRLRSTSVSATWRGYARGRYQSSGQEVVLTKRLASLLLRLELWL